MTRAQRAALLAVRAYQLALAPFAGGACRFQPTCSAYAFEAIERHGAMRGGWLAIRRVVRCHPWGPSGLDAVPMEPQIGTTRAAR